MGYEYEQGNNIMSHITAIEQLTTQLSDLGSVVSESQVITKITMTLHSTKLSTIPISME